jgi:predicted transcriptional regulator
MPCSITPMRIRRQQVTIVNIRKPGRSLNSELQWFGSSLGLFNLRDKDKSCFRIFIELIKAAKKSKPLTSDELADRLMLTRGTVVHHLNKLMDSGIVVHEGKRYLLRVNNLEILIDEIQKDISRTCEDLKRVAKDIDGFLGL